MKFRARRPSNLERCSRCGEYPEPFCLGKVHSSYKSAVASICMVLPAIKNLGERSDVLKQNS